MTVLAVKNRVLCWPVCLDGTEDNLGTFYYFKTNSFRFLKNVIIILTPSAIQNSVELFPLMIQLSHLWFAHGNDAQSDACQI